MTIESTEGIKLRDADMSHPAMQIAMPLVIEIAGKLRPVGTAFNVVPGLAITAAHVVDSDRWSEQSAPANGFPIMALQVIEKNLYRWDVDAVYGSRSSDIAFLRMRRPPWWGDQPGQVKPKYARLSFNPPIYGDEVLMFGFPRSEIQDGILYITPSECKARVLTVESNIDHPDIPHQYAKLEAEILNGMSGGPCFDCDWNVIGVVGCGWSFRYEAYVSLLWSAMSLQIDLFKSGSFPAVDLFTKGPATALGYRRIHVRSSGQALLAKVDPEQLIPLPGLSQPKHLEDALNFTASNAQNALTDVRLILRKAKGNPLFDRNELFKALRYYFWELDSTLQLGIALAGAAAGVTLEHPFDWEQFKSAISGDADSEILDELAILGFSWYGIDLFEVRTYAQLWRSGTVGLTTISNKTETIGIMMEPCRRGGFQVNLDDGLERFYNSSRRFVQKLLRLSNEYNNKKTRAK